MSTDTRSVVSELTRSALALRPLAEAGHTLRVPGTLPQSAQTVFSRLGLAVAESSTVDSQFDQIVSSLLAPALAQLPAEATPDFPSIVDDVVADSFESWRDPKPVSTPDGAQLRTYSLGLRSNPAIVLASACGMPAQLCEPWMRHLAADHFVITWETRGLFGSLGDAPGFDRISHSVEAQAADLIAVMGHYGLGSAHLMGLCGGAVIALAAAAAQPARVSSMSLWHGDFSGSECPTTTHQDNLKALMAMALTSRDDAAAINTALLGTAMSAVPADVAHLVVYPYLSSELFYRYCALTNPTMTTSTASMLARATQPTLIVTSEDDHTAHPAGSHHVAASMPNATLKVEPHGDHISVFGAGDNLKKLIREFLTHVGS